MSKQIRRGVPLLDQSPSADPQMQTISVELQGGEPFEEVAVILRVREDCQHHAITIPVEVLRCEVDAQGAPVMGTRTRFLPGQGGAIPVQEPEQVKSALIRTRLTLSRLTVRRRPSDNPGEADRMTFDRPAKIVWWPLALAQKVAHIFQHYVEIRVCEMPVLHEAFSGTPNVVRGALEHLLEQWGAASPLQPDPSLSAVKPAILSLDDYSKALDPETGRLREERIVLKDPLSADAPGVQSNPASGEVASNPFQVPGAFGNPASGVALQ